MSADCWLLYLHAITPIHSGTGQDAAVIDLPIAREKATGWPVIPGSSLKGVLKFESDAGDQVYGSNDSAGALCFTDQRILCLPVRSFFGTFAYVTCPLALQRLTRDATAMRITPPRVNPGGSPKGASVHISAESVLVHEGKVYLEDLDLSASQPPDADGTANALAAAIFTGDAEQQAFAARFALVSDEVFNFFSETATEVSARIVLGKDSKTSQYLWYEEAVPAEAIFCGAVLISEHARRSGGDAARAEQVRLASEHPVIQIGGKSSVGRGLCRVVMAP